MNGKPARCLGGVQPMLFALGDKIFAVADVEKWAERPDRECIALKCWSEGRYVLGRYFPGPEPTFASDAAPASAAMDGKHKLRKRRPVKFGKVMILPVTGWYQEFL